MPTHQQRNPRNPTAYLLQDAEDLIGVVYLSLASLDPEVVAVLVVPPEDAAHRSDNPIDGIQILDEEREFRKVILSSQPLLGRGVRNQHDIALTAAKANALVEYANDHIAVAVEQDLLAQRVGPLKEVSIHIVAEQADLAGEAQVIRVQRPTAEHGPVEALVERSGSARIARIHGGFAAL